jgi:hypothetical protein
MKSRTNTVVGRVALALILAVTLALLSSFVQHVGPEKLPYGNLCGRTASDPCMEPVLKGGFPFAFLFDAPGISRERQISFVEDDLRIGPLLLDVFVYLFALLLIKKMATRLLSRMKRDDRRDAA